MSYYCVGYGHVCCFCGYVNQWPEAQDWQSGCGGDFLVKCYTCERVTSTLGWTSRPVRIHDLWYAEIEELENAVDWDLEVKKYFDPTKPYGSHHGRFAGLPRYDNSFWDFEGSAPESDFDQSKLHVDTSGEKDRILPRERYQRRY